MADIKHQIIKDLLDASGNDFLAEMRLYNMLADFDYFRDCGSSKMAFREVISKGYVHTILAYYKGCTGKHELFSFISDLEASYTKQTISYALQCMFYGLGLIDDVESYDNVRDYAWLERMKGPLEKRIEVDLWNSEFAVINVDPTDALVSVDGQVLKQKDGIISQEFNVGDHLLEAFAPNHHPYKGTFSVKADDTTTLNIRLVPMFGKLLVMSNAKNAVVFVDGKEYGPVPNVITPLTTGRHEIVLKDPLYKEYKETIEIHDDEKLQLNIVMEGNSGNVSFKNSHPEVSIFVDGTHLGKGDWTGPLPSGRHKVECARHSFLSKTIYINVEPNKTNHFELPELEAYYGCLKVNVFPIGARVLLDGEYIGNSPLKYKNAYIGRHTVTIYEEECGNKIVKQVNIQEGKITSIDAELPRTFLRDFSQLRIGDYYYADGTFTHEKSDVKEAVGVVFTLETTEEEKKHGWTHGQIMALKNAGEEDNDRFVWYPHKQIIPSIANYESLRPSKKSEKDERYDAIEDKNGYIYSHAANVEGHKELEAFLAASSFNPKLKEPETSGWYLPSSGQWYDIMTNLFNVVFSLDWLAIEGEKKLNEDLCQKYNFEYKYNFLFWASTQCKEEFAWGVWHNGSRFKIVLEGFRKTDKHQVRPVAAI